MTRREPDNQLVVFWAAAESLQDGISFFLGKQPLGDEL